MDWDFETLVLYWQNFDAQNYLIKEKLCKRVVLIRVSISVSFLSLETKVDTVFHDEETPLVRVVFEAVKHLGVNLGHGPRFKVSRSALCVHKTVAQFCADRNSCISKLVQTFSANFAVVANQSAHNLKVVVRPNLKVGLHAFHQRTLQVVAFYLDHYLERKAFEQSQLAAEVIRVFVNGNPNLVGIVCVLAIHLVQTKPIVH